MTSTAKNNKNPEFNHTMIHESTISSEIAYTKSYANEKTIDESDCHGSFVFPKGCNMEDCQYRIVWKVEKDLVNFKLNAKIPIEHWTGIGFSSDGAMVIINLN